MVELTPRQRQVADLVALGLTGREIAERLGVSVGTVKQHKKDIYQKLGANNAVEMARALSQ